MDDQERLTAALSDRYRIEREIARGGMATVYLAHDLRHDRLVAVKVLDPELGRSLGGERFLREIKTTANLTHPHILPVHDSGEADGLLYYVMPYVEGESLRSLLRADGALPVEEALRIAREIADALAYAHEQGIVHRDVKPGNIMLAAGHAVLADFGVAHAVVEARDERMTRSGVSVGTPVYMSPEQAGAERDLDGRSDQYALACVLHEMLAGEPPFSAASDRQVRVRHMTAEPPSITAIRPEVPGHVEAALLRALSKSPDERFDTTTDFAASLGGAPGGTSPPGFLARHPVARRALAGAAVVAVLLAIGLAANGYLRGPAPPGPPPADRPYTVLAAVEGSASGELRETAGFLLRSALDGSYVTQTVPTPAVDRMLRLMDRPTDAPVDLATAREVAERAGVSTVVQPRMDRVGDGFLVGARVETADSGRLVAEASRRAPDEDEVVAAVDGVSRELRRELGESSETLQGTAPLPDALTPSLEALRRYRRGMELVFGFRPREAIPLFREALALDPEFAGAHAALVGAFHNAGSQDSMLAHARRALERPSRLRPQVRRTLSAFVAGSSDFASLDGRIFTTGEHNNEALALSDFQYFDSAWTVIKRPARDRVRRIRRFNPDAALATDVILPLRNAVRIAIASGRIEAAEAFRDSLDVEAAEYWQLLRYLDDGDWDRADSVRSSAPGFWRTHVNKRVAVTMLDALRGRVATAHEKWGSLDYGRLSIPRGRLVLELLYGVEPPDTTVTLEGRGLRAVEAYLVQGVRASFFGDTAEARRVQRRLRAARDSATSELFERAFDPMFRLLDAGVAARRGDWAEARARLEPATGRLGEAGYGFSTDRFVVRWVLGRVYQETGQEEQAVRQLELLLRARGFDPVHAMTYPAAHFELAHLRAVMGEPERAARHYAAFLDAFTDPDPEYEWMVEEARAELDRLGDD